MSKTLRLCMMLVAMISFSIMGYSQAYVITPSATNVGNPGGIRTGSDASTAGTSAWSGPQTTLTWSASQAIPFTFNFYGSPVTHFIVTGNGLISFDTTNAGQTAVAGLSTNAALPSADLPDKTICMFWEDFTGVTSSSDDVYVELMGSSPNQQLWIRNYSMKIGACSFFYSGVVLEEGTDKIYIVDMNYGSGTMTATCGIQVDGTTAYEITGSPNIQFGSGGSSATDNEYWEFAYYGAGACIPPTAVSSGTVGATTADVNFNLGAATTGEIEYGPAGFVQGAGTTAAITGSTTTLTSLTPATAYEYYVRGNCSGTFSNWAGPYSFVTTCVIVNSFPYTEDFDGTTWSPTTTYDQCWSVTSPGSYRWQVNSGGTSSGSTGPSSDASGSGQYIYTEASSSGGDALAQMPEFDLTSLTSPELEFKYHMYGQTMTSLYIEASLDTGTTWMTIDSIIGQQQTSNGDAWKTWITDLNSVKSAYTLLRFRGQRGSNFYGDASLDEITVHEAPPCPTPTGFVAFNIGSTTADVTFNAASGASRSIEWGPQGFTPGTGGTATSTTDTVNITGLPPGTCLDIYIQADCSGAGNGVSAVSGPFTICTAYQPDWLENFDNGYPGDDFLEAIGVFNGGSIAYGSSNWNQDNYGNVSGASNAARFNIYSTFQANHWMVSPSIDLGTGNTYNFEYDVAWTEFANTTDAVVGVDDTVHVVISLDNGATWDRSNILMSYHQGNVVSAAGTHEVIQLSGYSGIVRFGWFETSTVSNEDTDFFIDNIEVRTPPACLEPFGFATINVLPDSVYFTFTGDSAASSFNMEWGPCGFTQGTGMTANVTNDTTGIGGLSAATCYEIYLQTDCGTGQSVWSGPFQFTTACDTLPIPWNEGFETSTPGAGNYPACWNWITNGSTFYVGTASGTSGSNPGPRSGANYLYHRYSFNNSWWSFTPEFNLVGGQSYEVSFWYQTEGTGVFDEVELAFGTGQTAADMSYSIKQETGVSSSGYTQFVATFIPPTTDRYHIGLRTLTTAFSGVMDIDDFQLQLDPSPCPTVSSLFATVVAYDEADLSWGSTSAHTTFDVEWGPQGFQVGTGIGYQYYGLTSASLNLDTLSESTCYDFYVRADCGSGMGAWVGPYTWCTPCSPISTFPALEDFNSSNWGVLTTMDDCWTMTPGQSSYRWQVDNNSTSSGSTGPLGDATGTGNYVYTEASSGVLGAVTTLESRGYDLTSLTIPELSFYYHMYGQTIDRLYIEASAAGGSWVKLDSLIGEQQTSSAAQWLKRIVPVPASLNSSNTVFRFRAIRGSSFYGDISIDEVLIQEQPTCPQPLLIDHIVSAITTTGGTVFFTPGGASDFNISYAPAGTVTNPINGTLINATNDTAVINTMSPATLYDVWVRDSCAAGDVSAWTGPTTFQTLCVPFTTPYMEDFNAWPPACWDINLGGQPWVQYGGQWAEASFWSYNNTTMVMNTPQVILSDSSELSFDWSHLYNANYPFDGLVVRTKNVNTTAWDTIFDREGANLNSQDGAGSTVPGSGVTEYLSIPNNGAGDTIQVQFWGNSDFGPDVFVDNVHIYDRPACAPPSNFAFESSVTTGATFTWTAGSAASTSWVIEVGAPGFTPGSGTSTLVTNDTASVSGLLANSNYCAYLTEICPGGLDSSTTVGPVCFQTACAPFGIPYSEDFTSSTLSSCFSNYNTANNTAANAFWKMTNVSWMGYGAAGKSDHTGNGGYAIGVDASSPYDASMDSVLLLTPYIDITGHTGLELSFWVFSDASAYTYPNNDLHVSALTPTGWVNIHTYSNDSSDWEEIVVPLTGLGLSDTTRFMFGLDKTASSYFYDDLVIDDILVQTPPTCPTVGAISFANLTQTGSDASWDTTASPQTYQIEYGPIGFTPGSGTSVIATTNSYTFNGLPANNLVHEMYIRPICGGTDTGYWSGPTEIEKAIFSCDDFEAYGLSLADEQSYLIQGWNGAGGDAEISSFGGSQALHIYDTGVEGFSDVVAHFDTITSGMSVLSFDFHLAAGAGGYYNILHNYTGPSNVWAIEVYMDANGTATVEEGTNGTNTIGTYSFNTTGWNTIEHYIDLDNDTAWIVVNGNTTTVGWQFSLGSVNFGDRFNAVNFYSAANTGQTPNYYVDNFCVCPSPGGSSVVSKTCTSIELDWSSLEPTSMVEYGVSGFTPGSGTMVTGAAPLTVSGLMAGTAYDFYIGDVCGGDTLYTMVTDSTDNGPLPTLSATAVLDSVDASILIEYWTFDAGSTNADTVYWNIGGVSVSGETTQQLFQPGTYTAIVTASNDCGSVTDTITFTVTVSLNESALARSLNVYPNPTSGVVTLSFELQADEEVTLNVVNGVGQKVIEENLGKVNSYNGQLDLSELPRGVYILRVSSGSGVVNQRVTLQ